MRLIYLIPLIFSIIASAGTVSRVNQFQANTKIEAADLNDEFDNILDTINGNLDYNNLLSGGVATANIGTAAITTIKINNGAVTRAKHATSSDYYLRDYRKGCNLFYSDTVTQSVLITPPCKIIVDGWVGEVTATQTVGGLDSGSMGASKVYYVYGAVNGAYGIDLQSSATTPDATTFRKTGDTTRRYIGSFSTGATSAILRFKRSGNRHFLAEASTTANIGQNTLVQLNIPPFAVKALMDLRFNVTTSTGAGVLGNCETNWITKDATFNNTQDSYFDSRLENAAQLGTRTFIPTIASKIYHTGLTCTGGSSLTTNYVGVTTYGWEEPLEMY